MQCVLVAAGDDDLYRQFQDTIWPTPVHIYNFVNEMLAFMQASDCIGSKAGGLIVAERWRAGCPC